MGHHRHDTAPALNRMPMDRSTCFRRIVGATEAIRGGELFVSHASFAAASVASSFLLLKSTMEEIGAILHFHDRKIAT